MVSQECYKKKIPSEFATWEFSSQLLVTEQGSNSLAKPFYRSLASSIFNIASTRGFGHP